MKKHRNRQDTESEKGAIVVEASISLPIFIFMMIILYSIAQIAFVQARMSVAVQCSAKELAEYAHVWFVSGANGTLSGSGGASSNIANEVAEFLQEIGSNLGSVNSELGQYVSDAGTALSGDSIVDLGKYGMAETLAKQMMHKNMVSGKNDSYEGFIQRNRINNFNMDGSNFLEEASKNVFLRANYDIEIIKLLKLEYSFHLSSCAYTEAWGGEGQ